MANLVDYSGWTEGTGSTTGWTATGTNTTYENVRLYAPDPWGKNAVVWQIRSEDNTGYAGGFNSSQVSVDTDYDYRFSVYANRLGAAGERSWLGCTAYNSGSTTYLQYLSTGTNTNNPYFSFWYNSSYLNEWVLLVGFIRKSSVAYTDPKHVEGGVWRLDGTLIEPADYEYRFNVESYTYTHTRIRYFYNDASDKWPDFVENVAYPRIEKMDGTQLSMKNLLRGPYPMFFGKKTGLGSALIKVKQWH